MKAGQVSFESALQDLFFPDQHVDVIPVGNWSPNVKLVKANDEEYVAKSLDATDDNLHALNTGLEWSEQINQINGIVAPRFIATKNSNYFPIINTDRKSYLSVMSKVDNKPFELEDLIDYERMGIAIGLLHKAARKVKDNHVSRFEFSKTNRAVEGYWGLQTSGESDIFNRILQVPNNFNELPSQLTHNDIHPENLLSHKGIPLFLDFDQMLVGPRINDIGQALSSFWLEESESGLDQAMSSLIKGYNLISPLNSKEINAIPLFALRKACISFVWFKGLAQKGDSDAYGWYKRIFNRAQILEAYLENNGYFNGRN